MISEKDIEIFFKEREEFRHKFYQIFEKFEVRQYLKDLVKFGEIDHYFDLCYQKTRAFRVASVDLERNWIERNRKIQELNKFIKQNDVAGISIKRENNKINIPDSLARELSMIIGGYLTKSESNKNTQQRIKHNSLRNNIIISLSPFYEHLYSNTFTGKGAKVAASIIIMEVLQLFGYTWGENDTPELIREIYRRNKTQQ